MVKYPKEGKGLEKGDAERGYKKVSPTIQEQESREAMDDVMFVTEPDKGFIKRKNYWDRI